MQIYEEVRAREDSPRQRGSVSGIPAASQWAPGPDFSSLSVSLHSRTNDTQPLHAELKSGAVHPQSRRRATRSGDHPLGVFQGRENVLTFCLLQRPPLGANLT